MGRDGNTTEKDLIRPPGAELVIVPRTVDIGGFAVHRVLPSDSRRMVGPFIFWDHMGPGSFAAGRGVDVRPHPHIGLSTVTYLFDGSLDHRDSLGNSVRIVPGDVNLMHAGRGIVHSERTGKDVRQKASQLAGIQSWLAQPVNREQSTPAFTHTDAAAIPAFEGDGLRGRLVLGSFEHYRSPIKTQWETLYLELSLEKGSRFAPGRTTEERAVFIVKGLATIGGSACHPNHMVVLRPGAEVILQAEDDAHLVILGGAPMDGPRYIWWNFVASSIERIKEAADRWQKGAFSSVPGDEQEYIPLPEREFPRH